MGKREWWKKNGKWVALGVIGIGTIILGAIKDVLDNSYDDETGVDDSMDETNFATTRVQHEPGEKYWNPNTYNWEKDGKPYTYRVSYKDIRDGEIHTHDYEDVDNGYEDFEYYDKRWYSIDTKWEHIPPEEE